MDYATASRRSSRRHSPLRDQREQHRRDVPIHPPTIPPIVVARDARGAITAFTINREVANGIRFDRVK
jgi:hypothetical protein